MEVGAILDGKFGTAVPVGLHCAPLVHQTIGVYQEGGVRISFGPFNTRSHIDQTIEAMKAICRVRRKWNPAILGGPGGI